MDEVDKAEHHLDAALKIDENFILALISRGMLNQELQERSKPFENL